MIFVARAILQMAITSFLGGAGLILIDAAKFRSGWNALWMLGIPFAVAWTFNPKREFEAGLWPLAGLFLLLWSWLSMSVFGAMLGAGS